MEIFELEENDFNLIYKLEGFAKFENSSLISYENKLCGFLKLATIFKRKYDLIDDYKKRISESRKKQIISKLLIMSEKKYDQSEYLNSIKSLRRAWRYY